MILCLVLALHLVSTSRQKPNKQQKLQSSMPNTGATPCASERVWIRDDRMYMHIQAFSEKDGGTLWGVRQYWLDNNQQLQRTGSKYATYNSTRKNWVLHNGRQTTLTPQNTSVDEFSERPWENAITPKLLSNQAFLEPKRMSLLGLNDQIDFLQQQQLQATQYELAFWSRILKPLNYFGMALLALAIVLGPLRSTGLGPRLALGLFVGLSFKYLQDLFAPMSVVFALPAPLAVALPVLLYIVAGWLLIRRYA